MKEFFSVPYFWWHPLEGAFVVILCVAGYPLFGILFFLGFMFYEKQEYREIKDTCAKDWRDFLIGYGISAFTALLVGWL